MAVVELSDQEWQQILQMLSEAPWRLANPLLMKIGEQLRAQALAQPVQQQTNSPEVPVAEDKVVSRRAN
jgi:hypothetical protein